MDKGARRQVWGRALGRTAIIAVVAVAMTWAILTLVGRSDIVSVGTLVELVVSLVIALASTYRTFRLIQELEEARNDLEDISTHDYLTGIYNRRFMVEQATTILSLSRRHGFPVALIMMDLDHFKAVNDTHGHAKGDAVLIELADAIRGMIRTTDVFGRYGGEEFIVFMPHANLEDATRLAERIRWEVKNTQISGLSITLSMGVTVAGEEDKALDGLIGRADVALYEAKNSGRDRVVVAD